MRVRRFRGLQSVAGVAIVLGAVLAANLAPSSVGPLADGSAPTVEAASSADSFPAAISANRRYLVEPDGTPYLVHGDSAWSLIVELNQNETRQYLDNRRAYGFNLLLVSVVEHAFTSNPPANASGDSPFLGAAFGTPNEAYFEHLDWVVAQARERGITLLLVPAYLGYNGGSEGWYSEVVAASNADMRAYGEFLGERYRNAPNIIWAIGGDYSPPSTGRSRMEALAAGLTAADPGHLMTAHTSPEDSAGEIWGGSSWLDIDTVYTYGSAADATAAVYGNNALRPIIFLEGIYENEQGVEPSRIRSQAWASLLSGASGQIFGNNPIWHFGSGGLYPTNQTWQQAMNGRGSIDMSHVRSLYDSIPWHRLQPDRSDRFLVGGERSGTNRAAASTSDGDGLAIVFVPGSRTITVDLSQLSTDLARVRWYDPTNGSYRTVGSFATSGTRDFSTPGSNSTGDGDWVLVVDNGSVPAVETLSPARLLETRPGRDTVDGSHEGIGRAAANSVTKVRIAGRGGVPTNATAAMLNLTIATPSDFGYATIYPCTAQPPNASSINYTPGAYVANSATAKLDNNGDVCIYTLADTHILIDANGYVRP